ncbi:MAG TPA: AAA family ATPase, partial [Ilumatobacteraceae bacterium]|nr:AAA family ATPase [Ilumatobacteraceae bacterium]
LNVLITVMSERELHVPRLGRVVAEPGFRLVAAMNPFDAVGTARISSAVYDRVCRLSVDYQSATDEEAIVAKLVDPTPDLNWLAKVVQVVRSTRTHPDVRIGSSVRGAIDVAAVAASLAPLRHSSATAFDVGLDSAIVALSGRLRLRDGVSRSAESVVTELWTAVFTEHDPESTGKVTAPNGAMHRTH